MDKHERLAIIRALEAFIEENGEVWYSYADNEKGTTVDLTDVLVKVESMRVIPNGEPSRTGFDEWIENGME